MGARRGKFDEEEAGSLVENNLVASATLVLEQTFERSFESALLMDSGWQESLLHAGLAFVIYNTIKGWSLLVRDEHGRTRVREFGAYLWRNCKEWILP